MDKERWSGGWGRMVTESKKRGGSKEQSKCNLRILSLLQFSLTKKGQLNY